MNFDNLVGESERLGAGYVDEEDSFYISLDQLKALITQYILADRAQGQAPVAWMTVRNFEAAGCVYDVSKYDNFHLPDGEYDLFTHAQPTPAQIAEIQATLIEQIADEIHEDDQCSECGDTLTMIVDNLNARAAKLRKGEPL